MFTTKTRTSIPDVPVALFVRYTQNRDKIINLYKNSTRFYCKNKPEWTAIQRRNRDKNVSNKHSITQWKDLIMLRINVLGLGEILESETMILVWNRFISKNDCLILGALATECHPLLVIKPAQVPGPATNAVSNLIHTISSLWTVSERCFVLHL